MWSKFGSITINDNEIIQGIKLDDNGNYDIDNKNIENVDNIDAISGNFETIYTNNIDDNGDANVKFLSDVTYNGNMLLSDNNTTIQKSNIQLHIQDKKDVNIWLEADTDNFLEGDIPSIYLTQDGGGFGGIISGRSDNSIRFLSGNSANASSGDFRFFSGLLDNSNYPIISESFEIIRLRDNRIDMYQFLDMNNNTINNATNITTSNITLDTISASSTDITVNNELKFSGAATPVTAPTNTSVLTLGGTNNIMKTNISDLISTYVNPSGGINTGTVTTTGTTDTIITSQGITAGKYLITAYCGFETDANNGKVIIRFVKDTTTIISKERTFADAGDKDIFTFTYIDDVTATTDYYLYLRSDGTNTATAGNFSISFCKFSP